MAGLRTKPALSEWELWAVANEMIRRHGDQAAIHAAMRADWFAKRNQPEGAEAWKAIVRRINLFGAKPVGPLN